MFFKKIKDYCTRDIWEIWSGTLPRAKALKICTLRVLILTGSKFNTNRCMEKAATLTFINLLSIVPLVALALAFAHGFNLDGVENYVRSTFVGQEQIADWIIQFAEATLKTASGSAFTCIGIGMLFWTFISLLSKIENAFNDIWGIQVGRTWMRKLSDYLTMLILCPIMVFALVSFTAIGMTHVETILKFLPMSRHLIQAIRSLFPLFLAWFTFFFLFYFVPNTHVKCKSAAIGALFTGIGYLILQYVYMILQSSLTSYNAIYGGFAAFPFFLLWLRSCWILILLGAQFTFSVQNVNDFEFYPGEQPLSVNYLLISSLRIMQLLSERFLKHEKPISIEEISSQLKIPIRPARQLMTRLITSELVTECKVSRFNERTFVVSYPVEKLSPRFIMTKLFNEGCFAYRTEDFHFWESNIAAILSQGEINDFNVAISDVNPKELEIAQQNSL